MKTYSRLVCFACVLALANSVWGVHLDKQGGDPLGEDEQIKAKLHLKTYTRQDLELPADAGSPVQVQVVLEDDVRTLELTPHTMRSADFTLMVHDETGLHAIAAPSPRTYRGGVAGIEGSRVAASLFDGQLRAAIFLPGEDIYWNVQPVSDVVKGAPCCDHVIFSSKDTQGGNWKCGNDELALRPHDVDVDGQSGGIAGSGLKTCDIAIDSDFELYVANGMSVPATLFDIEDIMNRVETLYEAHVGIRITYEITTIIVHTTPVDDYASAEPVSLLNEFRSKWNLFMGEVRRDVAHLMTGSPNGIIIGIAYVAVICDTPDAYGLSYTRYSSNLILRTCLTAHELGHNWSAQHCDGQSDCGIMCSAIGSCTGNCALFGAVSVNEIASHRNSRWCLADQPDSHSLPFVETFSSTTFDSQRWTYVDGASIDNTAVNVPSAPFAMRLDASGSEPFMDDEARTNFILATGHSNVPLTFRTQHRGVEAGEQLVIEYRNNNLTWVEIDRLTSDGIDQDAFQLRELVLPFDACHNELRLRFRAEVDESNDAWYVDDVEIGIESPCPGDINGDDAVDVDDLLEVINTWGECTLPCAADVNGDAEVNVDDLLAVINAWGDCL